MDTRDHDGADPKPWSQGVLPILNSAEGQGRAKGPVSRGSRRAISTAAAAPPLGVPTDLGDGELAMLSPSNDSRHLASWAQRYLQAELIGLQSRNTLDAKTRDLSGFIRWFMETHGHAIAAQWRSRDTQAYLDHLEDCGRAATTVNRVLATLRRCARWMEAQPGAVFAASGRPTYGVRELVTEEPACKRLQRRDIEAMFRAADTLVQYNFHKSARPRRNRAVLALLRYTGLRASELGDLRRGQLRGNHLMNVLRKGRSRSKSIYLVDECRRHLDDYLTDERWRDDAGDDESALLVARDGGDGFLTRQMVYVIIRQLATEANKNRAEGDKVDLSPHWLRHNFAYELREQTGSDTETAAALGHRGLAHVARYTRESQAEREAKLEAIFRPK